MIEWGFSGKVHDTPPRYTAGQSPQWLQKSTIARHNCDGYTGLLPDVPQPHVHGGMLHLISIRQFAWNKLLSIMC